MKELYSVQFVFHEDHDRSVKNVTTKKKKKNDLYFYLPE